MRWKKYCTKVRYKTRKIAWRAALYYFIHLGHYQTPYHCNFCHHFHLTSKKADPLQSKEFIKGFNEWFGSDVL